MTNPTAQGAPELPPLPEILQHQLSHEGLNAAREWLIADRRARQAAPEAPRGTDVAKMVKDAREWLSMIDQVENAASIVKVAAIIDALGAAATQARAAAPALAREPLTDEQVVPLFHAAQHMKPVGEKDPWFWFAWGVELGERAHGITADSARAAASEPPEAAGVEL